MHVCPAAFSCFLLIVYCCAQLVTGTSNDSPHEVEHRKVHLRVKLGTPITLRCPYNATIWEYKQCSSSFQGLVCDEKPPWTLLNLTKGRKHISATEKWHSGLYRCLDSTNTIRREFLVDVVHPGYSGSRPYVAPLRISNLTGQINMEFTIQCNVTSEVPPTIFWFKSCYGQKCDIEYNRVCYCHLNSSISSYNLGSTYLSKYSIFNARDVDSGVYACLAVTQYGENSQNVTIRVPQVTNRKGTTIWILIPVLLVLTIVVWLCYCRRKKKKPVLLDQQKQLIRPVVGNVV